jgi:NADPH:quinone reductase
MGTTGLAASEGVDDALHLKPGQTAVIYGAHRYVGTLAMRFAKLRDSRVIAIASRKEATALAGRLGADSVADGAPKQHRRCSALHRTGVGAVLALTGGEGVERYIN